MSALPVIGTNNVGNTTPPGNDDGRVDDISRGIRAILDASIRAGGKLKCNATLTLRHTPFPNEELRGHMDAVAKRLGFPAKATAHG